MTVETLIAMLKQFPPNVKAYTYNSSGEMVEVGKTDIVSGDDDVWHEKQSEDVLLIS